MWYSIKINSTLKVLSLCTKGLTRDCSFLHFSFIDPFPSKDKWRRDEDRQGLSVSATFQTKMVRNLSEVNNNDPIFVNNCDE